MNKKIEKPKAETKEDVRSLMLHLESEYRKANISEKHYKELKEKYQKMMDSAKPSPKKEIPKKPAVKKDVVKDVPKPVVLPKAEEPEPDAPAEPIEDSNVTDEPSAEDSEEEDSEPGEENSDDSELKRIEEQAESEIAKPAKKGLFGSLFGKKKSDPVPAQDTPSEDPPAADPPKPDSKPSAKKAKKEEEEEITEITPEVIERLAQKAKEEAEHEGEEASSTEEKKSGGGLLKSIFGKKGKDGKDAAPAQPVQEQPAQASPQVKDESSDSSERYRPSGMDFSVEIEKIKVMIDSVRESGKLTDESVRSLSENLGEIRSMVFQTDADLKENAVKMEKIEDDINEVKPDEISKKLREIDEKFEKNGLESEKLDRKTEDAGAKINKVFEILKSIGGIENLVNINTDIQKKLDDINEAMKYVERIGLKTEKMFIELNKGLQDLVIIRSQQDDFNESMKDMIKNMDAMSVRFEGYVSKKDLDTFREDVMVIKKQIDEVKKVLPIMDLKLPENIISLRKEREDIRMLMESLQDQFEMRKISRQEYENIKNANSKRLDEIKVSLESEWKKVESLVKPEGGAQVEEEIEKSPEKLDEKISEDKSKESEEKNKDVKPKPAEKPVEEKTEEYVELKEDTDNQEDETKDADLQGDLEAVEKQAEKEMKVEPKAKKGILKGLFNKKKETPASSKQAEPVVKVLPPLESKIGAPEAEITEPSPVATPEAEATEPEPVATPEIEAQEETEEEEPKEKIIAKTSAPKAKVARKEAKPKKPKSSSGETARKLKILKDIKKMR
jgi:hypothetical protein